ncbi:hypothetical protein ACSVBT_04485 [Afipia sp. TerB]
MSVFNLENDVSRRTPAAAGDFESRGIIVQLFDRIAEARMQRDAQAFCRMKQGKRQGDTDTSADLDC